MFKFSNPVGGPRHIRTYKNCNRDQLPELPNFKPVSKSFIPRATCLVYTVCGQAAIFYLIIIAVDYEWHFFQNHVIKGSFDVGIRNNV